MAKDAILSAFRDNGKGKTLISGQNVADAID
jgi:hypothetical protein